MTVCESSSKSNHSEDTEVISESDEQHDTSNICPLFLDGLPRDFATNPALAALASLLEDEVLEEDNSQHSKGPKGDITAPMAPCTGGGKVTLRRQGNHILKGARHKPYDTKKKNTQKTAAAATTTVTETQLFFGLWKM